MAISSIDQKLLRDFWQLRGQSLAIALVIASGIATLAMSLSTLDSLSFSQQHFYQTSRFATVFASITRAPKNLEQRLRLLPGVAHLETRVVAPVRLKMGMSDQPVGGKIISLPDSGSPLLNDLFIFKGRTVKPGHGNEVVINNAFAEAHHLQPGDSLNAIINGRINTLTIVGTATSPEYVIHMPPGTLIPDYKRYGIFWMSRRALAALYDMSGAFNDLTLSLAEGANAADVIDQLDEILSPYGAIGAYGRDDQASHRFLSMELEQLSAMATLIPAIFLAVAAFLFNIVISRIIAFQREQIATLKAFGYSNISIAWHYIKLVLIITMIGAAIGLIAGIYMGQAMSDMYSEYYRLPFLLYRLEWPVVVLSIVVSIFAACGGALFALYRAVRLPPAEAMHPEAPLNYRQSFVEKWGGLQFFSTPEKMIIRQLQRRPLKVVLSTIGTAMACAIIILGSFGQDSVRYMLDIQFKHNWQEDIGVNFTEAHSINALGHLRNLPGVYAAEPFRFSAVELRAEHRRQKTVIQGYQPSSQLRPNLDLKHSSTKLPDTGLVINQFLAKTLRVKRGDMLTVKFLEGSRKVREVPVTLIIDELSGILTFMNLDALNRLLGEGDRATGAWLAVDLNTLPDIYRTLNNWPDIVGSYTRQELLKNFTDMLDEQIVAFMLVTTLLAGCIAFGVIYNSMRISLSERAGELASLRILGFTTREITYILLGEQSLIILVAIPLGFLSGYGLCVFLVENMATDLFRMPLIINRETYTAAALIVIVSGLISGLIVWRRIKQLDMVSVLKTGS